MARPAAPILAGWPNRLLQWRHQRADARNREGARLAQSLVAPGLSVVRLGRPRRDGGRGRHRPEFEGACAQHSARGCRGTQSAPWRGSRRADAVAAASKYPQYSNRRNGRKYGGQIAQMSDHRELLASVSGSRPQIEIALRLQFGDPDHTAAICGDEARQQISQPDVLGFHGVAAGGELDSGLGELTDPPGKIGVC